MSRTYQNCIRRNNACGSNTGYYRGKRRWFRALLANALNNAIKTDAPDEVFVHPEKAHQFVDRWREPTDGHGLIRKFHASPKGMELDMTRFPYPFDKDWMDFCKRKWYSKLKNKHRHRIKKSII